MAREPRTPVEIETNRLLTELDDLLGQSVVMRDIVDQSERLYSLELMTGQSSATRNLRREIEIKKRELSRERRRCGRDKMAG